MRGQTRPHRFISCVISATLAVLLAVNLHAETFTGEKNGSTQVKGRLDPNHSSNHIVSTYAALSLPRGGLVHISSQKSFDQVTEVVSESIQKTYDNFEQLFGPLPAIQVQVKLLTPEVFSLATGAPDWTNALFYEDTIIIPVRENARNEDLVRSIHHEFTHAITHTLTDGKAPGWLDEGIAQYMEGPVHPLIRKALAEWLKKNPPVPFHMLQNGFTRLETRYVAPAYAESLWAVRRLIDWRGPLAIRNYLDAMKKQAVDPFVSTIGISESSFEYGVGCVMKRCFDSPGFCTACE